MICHLADPPSLQIRGPSLAQEETEMTMKMLTHAEYRCEKCVWGEMIVETRFVNPLSELCSVLLVKLTIDY